MTDAPLPNYEAPRLEVLRFGLDLVIGRRRSFVRDGRMMLNANPYPRRIEGVEHAPATGTFVLVMNHYSRAGLRPYHCAFVASVALADRHPGQPEVRWAFTSEYLGRRIGPIPIPLPLIRWVFRRVAVVTGFVVLPRREALVMGRATALRQLVRLLAHAPIGLTPEGLRASGPLVEPPEGNGLFLALLTRRGAPLLPAAVWEEGGTLVLRFGEPFHLSLPEELPRADQDRLARTRVMVAIGRLMPRRYWGAYDADIAVATGTPARNGMP